MKQGYYLYAVLYILHMLATVFPTPLSSSPQAGGKDALLKTSLVLSIDEEQQEEIIRSLFYYKFYGFSRENVILIAKSKCPGYRYDPGQQVWYCSKP